MYCSCDYDPPEFYSTDVHRARKPHRCEECRGVIAVGESYEYVAGKWEGCFSHFRTCQRCTDFRQWMLNNLPCFCWLIGALFENAREAAYEAHHRAGTEVAGLRFGVARRIAAIQKAAKASRGEEAVAA
jgi:hypothetical protein